MSETDPLTNRSLNDVIVLAILVIFASITFHSITRKLENTLRTHKHLSAMLNRLYRELAIFGVLSFILFILETSVKKLSSDFTHLFELVHILLFFCVVGYTLITFLLMILSSRLSHRWRSLEDIPHEQYVNAKKELKTLVEETNSLSSFRRFFDIRRRLRSNSFRNLVLFHDVRLQFIHSNRLSSDFSFSLYLQKCNSNVFLRLGDFSRVPWLILTILLLTELVLRNQFYGSFSESAYRLQLFVSGLLLMISSVLIYYKVNRILTKIAESELINFDPMAAEFYWDHNESGAGNDSVTCEETKYRFKREKTLRRITRMYRVDEWGASDPSRKTDESITQQEDLFWLRSHKILLRLIQSVIFLTVVYSAVLAQFHGAVLYNSSQETWFYYVRIVVILATIPVVLYFILRAIPVYTIIIHIGQLVDVETVLKAKLAGVEKATTVPMLTRLSTLTNLTECEKFRYRFASLLFSTGMGSFIMYCLALCLVNTSLVYVIDTPIPGVWHAVNVAFSVLFLVECGLKAVIIGLKQYFTWSFVGFFDSMVVLAFFSVSLFQASGLLSPLWSAIVIFRFVSAVAEFRMERLMFKEHFASPE